MAGIDFLFKFGEVGLKGISSASKSAFDMIQSGSARAKSGIDDLIARAKNIGAATLSGTSAAVGGLNNVGNAAQQASNAVDRLNDNLKNSGRGVFSGTMFGNLAADAVRGAGRLAIDAGREALGNGMDLERMKVGLQTFVGGRANDIVEGILKQAIRTPYTTQQLLPIEAGLIATGRTPERANRDMMSLANAIAGTGGSDYMLELAGFHLKQASAKGVIDGRVLREFQGTASIPIDRILGDYLYPQLKSGEARRKKADAFMENNTITYDVFTDALDRASKSGGFFAGAMDRLSQTMSGKNSTIKDAWWNMTAKLTESQMGPMKRWQDMIIDAIKDVPAIVDKLTPSFDKFTHNIDDMLPSLTVFGDGLMEVLKPIGGLILSDSVKNTLIDGLTEFGNALKGVAPVMKVFADGVKYWVNLLGFAARGGDMPSSAPSVTKRALVYSFNKDSLAQGFTPDSSKMFHPVDAKVFDSVGAVRAFNRAQPRNKQLPFEVINIPFLKKKKDDDIAKPKNTAGMEAAQEAAKNIVAGGQKVININLNAPIIKEQIFNVGTRKEADETAIGDFEERMLRVFYAAKAAM